jgi:hypothetical protein
MALLSDGRVLVVDGTTQSTGTGSTAVAAAEIYDPATGTFSSSRSTPAKRMHCPCGALDHAWMTPDILTLVDGRVLITGGNVSDGRPRTAELYDPATDTFERIDMPCDPGRGAQALLPGGKVLVTCLASNGRGGPEDPPQAALFDPTSNTFSRAAPPTTTASDVVSYLPDGRVLLTNDSTDHVIEIYDPRTGQFHHIDGQESPDGWIVGIDIGDGRLFFRGWSDSEQTISNLVFDVDALAFREIEAPYLPLEAKAVPLADGRILFMDSKLHAYLLDATQL